MSKSALRKIKLPNRVRPPALLSHRQHLHISAPCRSAITTLPLGTWDHASSSRDPKEIMLAEKYADLRRVLTPTHPDPNRVWGCYVDMLNFLGFEKLPVEVHQAVLRKCAPPAAKLRVSVARQIPGAAKRPGAHSYEARFQVVIRNIRSSGGEPSIDDYHFVLEQFAAVGHHLGVMQVLEEITRMGLPKSPKTYGLCLQALCHRLALPAWTPMRPQIVSDVTRLCLKLLNEMREQNVMMTSVNVDLAIRVLKETADLEAFQGLLKVAYGIDLAYPDRPPLEHWNGETSQTPHIAIAGTSTTPFPEPLPFSTAALNTTIDMLGRSGQVSKLVQAFEVLTTPLPPQATNFSPSFDDDDDDDFGISNPRVAPYRAPYAEPNTTTYHMLLKWLSKAGHKALARHYLLEAFSKEKKLDWRLRRDCRRKPPAQIASPAIAVNHNMLLAVYAEANRNKNPETMRWVLDKTKQVIELKKFRIKHYTRQRQRWRAASIQAAASADARETGTSSSNSPSTEVLDADDSVSTSNAPTFSTFFTPSSASKEGVTKTVDVPPIPYFDVNLDIPTASSPTPPKPFDIDTHLEILERDLESLQSLRELAADGLGRTIQRIKERLGRRVWTEKDIYLRNEGRRTSLSRQEWKERVNYRTTRTTIASERDTPDISNPPVQRDNAPHLKPTSPASSSDS